MRHESECLTACASCRCVGIPPSLLRRRRFRSAPIPFFCGAPRFLLGCMAGSDADLGILVGRKLPNVDEAGREQLLLQRNRKKNGWQGGVKGLCT